MNATGAWWPRRTSSCGRRTSAETAAALPTGLAGLFWPDGGVAPITSSLQYFRDEYVAHSETGGCPFDPAASTLFAQSAGATS